jgi:pimeloyl-ACP methyl ester carboxylesterase
LSLRDGYKFHYVTNTILAPTSAPASTKPLVIFLHGFPDSWAVWRHILSSAWLRESSNLVAVDLPGYGGSDLLERYSATQVHERLTEFIITVRELYGIDNSATESHARVIIVGHDWGCGIAMRLAAEAPQLADRFILSNGPLVLLFCLIDILLAQADVLSQIELLKSNIQRLVSSSVKMLKIFLHSPIRSRSMLGKALHTLKPIMRQVKSSGYVFALQLPRPIVRLQGSGGNGALLRMIHELAHGTAGTPSAKDIAESVASSLGPASAYGDATSDRYSKSVAKQGDSEKYVSMTNYYRHGTSAGRWNKSVETIAALYSIGRGSEIGRKSSHSGVFDEGPEGSLKSNATIVWGMDDNAIDPQLGLDGIADYLNKGSQVVILPRAQHHTIVEKEGRIAVQKIVEWAVAGEQGDVGVVAKAAYAGATVTVRT